MKSKNLTLAVLAVLSSVGVSTTALVPAQSIQLAVKSKKLMKGKIERDVAMADELVLKGKYADAADLYKQAISRNSKNINAIVGLGVALGKQFKLDGAEEQFDKAL